MLIFHSDKMQIEMKNKILILFSVLVAAGLSVSCSKYFDVPYPGALEDPGTYENADDATALSFLAGVNIDVRYLMMGDWGIHFLATSTVKSADSWPAGETPADGPDYQAMSRFTDNADTDAYRDMFQRLYRIMYRCNKIVSNLNDESPARQRVIAEAKAWRAWAMMHLTQLWGSAPLVDYVVGDDNYVEYPGNTPAEENWKWIMQQFDEAAEVLPSKTDLNGQAAIGGRWSKEACYAYKGKGYMWQNDYKNAKIELAKVINSGKYELWQGTSTMGPSSYGTNLKLYKENMTAENDAYNTENADEKGFVPREFIDGSEDYVYSTVFRKVADFCPEFILELDIDGNSSTIANTEPYWFRAYMDWRYDQINRPGNAAVSDGWGFIMPTKSFSQAFIRHDGNSPRRRANIATYDEVYRMFPYGNDDIRGLLGKEPAEGEEAAPASLFSCEGYLRMTYYDFLDDMEESRFATGGRQGNMTNYPLMRYSNVLLLYAEACCMDGETGEANITGLEALNLVRRRAGLDDAPALDMDNEEYGIKAERRFELYLEDCDRYVDLVRWGDYTTFIMDPEKVGEYWGTHVPYFYGFKDPDVVTEDPLNTDNYDIRYVEQARRNNPEEKNLLYPFPYEEMNQNPNLTQNPGW